MPWRVSKCGSCPPSEPWCVVKEADGEVVGCHSSREKAERHRRALHANEATVMFAVSEEEAAAEDVEEERESESPAFETAMEEFVGEYRARLAESRSLGAIEPLWVELTYEMLAEPLAEEATAQAIAVAIASGLDPQSVSQQQIDEMAAEHTAAFAAFGGFLAATVATTLVEKEPIVSVAGPPSTPEEVDEVIAPWLAVVPMARIVERTVVALRNGVTNIAVTGRRFLDATQRTRLGRVLPAVTPPQLRQEAAPSVPTKKWLTMLDARVRRQHGAVHGTVVPANETFLVGGYPARYPGDPTLPPDLRLNCRCFLTPGDADADVWVGWVRDTRAKVDCTGGLAAQGRIPDVSGSSCGLPEIGGLGGSQQQSSQERLDTLLLLAGGEFTSSDASAPTMSVMSTRPKQLMRWGQATGTFLIHGPDHTDGVMLACRPNHKQRAALAMDGGLPEKDLHLTLGYFGEIGDLTDPRRFVELLTETIDHFIKGNGTLIGEVSGIATFEANDERPLVALVDAPGLSALRSFLIAELHMLSAMDDNEDLETSETHDFQPHITLGYDPTEEDLEAALERIAQPVTFEAVELVIGTTRYEYPFSGTEEEESMRATPSPVEAAANLEDLSEGTLVVFDRDSSVGGVVEGMGEDGPTIRIWVYEDGEWVETEEVVEAPPDMVSVVAEFPIPPDDEEDDDDDMAAPPVAEDQEADSDTAENTRRAEARDFDWEGVLVPEGVESGDRRLIAEGALSWRDLPLTLMAQFQTPETGGHALSIPAGSIWEIERVGSTIVGRGFFDSGEAGAELRRMMEEGTIKGVSVDIDMVRSDIRPDDEGEMMILLEGRIMGACHDEKTEILTEDGWQRFSDVRQDVRVATLSKTGTFEWQQPTAMTREPWQGQMIRFASGGQQSGRKSIKNHRQMDMLVTPGHRMLVESTKTGRRSFMAARDLVEKSRRSYRIPMTSQWDADDVITYRVPWEGRPHAVAGFDGDWFAAFMGAWLAEGSLGSKGAGDIGIAQKPESKAFDLYSETFIDDEAPVQANHAGRSFRFSCRPLETYLRQFGKAPDKFVPEDLKNFSERQLWIFWHHFMAGDGSADGRRAYTSSQRLAGDLQEIAQKLGMWAHIHVRKPTGPKWIEGREIPAERQEPQYVVNVRNRPGSRPAACVWDWHGEYVDHDGSDVFCVTVPNETIYTRRDGIPIWAGNTATAFPAFQEAVLELVEVDAEQASALVASGVMVWEIDGSFYTKDTKDTGDSA